MNALCSEGRGTLFEGCFGVDQFADLGVALLLVLVLIVLPIALLIALALVRLFRARVKQSMRASEGEAVNPETYQRTPNGPPGELKVAVLRVTGENSRAARSTSLVSQLRERAREVALVYGGAACLQALVLATVPVAAIHFAPTDNVSLKFAILFISFFLVNASPVVLAPTIIVKRQLLSLILAVLALLVVLWAFDWAVGGDLAGMWLLISGVATGAILLLNIRRLRAVGPIVFAAALLFSYCAAGGIFYATAIGWNAIGPVHFVREDLAQLSLLEGMQQYLDEIARLPPPERLAEVTAVLTEPASFLKATHPEAITTKVKLEIFGLSLAAIVLGAIASFACVRWLAVHYRTRRASDQMLGVDVLMVIFTLSSLLSLAAAFGWVAGASAIPAFAAYSLGARYGLRRRQRLAPPVEPRTLLLLRVFGFDRRTQRLLQDVGQRWRYLGPIRLIGGVDLADSTLEPHEFFEFLNGRLTRAFVRNRQDLEQRLSEHLPVPDPDGLFRVQDFYCHENTWRMTVSYVARKADAVLMDLRGFSPSNRGCIFEIEQLIASVSVPRIVLLIDRTTDLSFLERTLQDAWRAMPGDSPNCRAGDHRLRVLLASARHHRDVDTLIGLLCESITLPATLTP
jgi:hypothetical protein